MDYLSGTAALVNIEFIQDGEAFVPDVGSVEYTVIDHSGAAIVGLQNIPVATTVDTWKVGILIGALYNSVDPSKKFERRTIVVTYTVDGVYGRTSKQYRIIPFLNHSVTPNDVRAFIGVQEKELPDSDIDLLRAYLYVEEAISPTDIGPVLASGTVQELAANRAITAQAVIDVLPSLRQRIAQEETNGITGFKRLTIKDFAEVEMAALNALNDAILEVLNPVVEDMTLILTTTDADPITG